MNLGLPSISIYRYGVVRKRYFHPHNWSKILQENFKEQRTYKEFEGAVLEEETSKVLKGFDESSLIPRSSKGFILLSTSLHTEFISLTIIDIADLQESSSLNASVHLPSTKAFVLSFPWAACLAGPMKGKVDGRTRRCNHLECLSSILGWKT